MEATPGTPPAKRTRAKSTPTAPKAPRKRATASRKKTAEAQDSKETGSISTPHDVHGMIEVAAFYRAVERNFAPGYELNDWLEAEREVLARLA